MLNQALVIGPVITEPKSYGKVTKFAVGGYREFKGQQEPTRTDVVCFSRVADKANNLRLGMLVAVTGRVESKVRDSAKGGQWASTDFIADDIRPIEAPAVDEFRPTPKADPLPPRDDWAGDNVPF